jgi:hypothetical protein
LYNTKIKEKCFYISLIETGIRTRKGVRVMVFNATFNNISIISWGLVLLMERVLAYIWYNRSPTIIIKK